MKRCTRLCYVLRLLHLIYCSEKLRPTPTHKTALVYFSSTWSRVHVWRALLQSMVWGSTLLPFWRIYAYTNIHISQPTTIKYTETGERNRCNTWMFKCPEIHKHTRHTHQLYEWIGPSTWNIGLVHGNKQTGKARRSNCLINVNHKCELLVGYETSRSK